MRDSFPFIDVLTIPIDAGPNDARIEIDGVNGEIRVYDTNGDLIGFITPDWGIGVTTPGDTPGSTGNQARFIIAGAPIARFDQNIGENFPPAVFGELGSQMQLVMTSGNFPARLAAAIELNAESSSGLLDDFIDLLTTDVRLNGDTMPRGDVGGFESSAGQVGIATGTSGLFSFNAPVIAGRRYRFPHVAKILVSANSAWRFNLRAAGVSILEFWEQTGLTVLGTYPINASPSWVATTTGTVTFDILATRTAGAGTFDYVAPSAGTRQLRCVDEAA